MKKIILVISFVVSLVALVGCVNEDTTDSSSTSSTVVEYKVSFNTDSANEVLSYEVVAEGEYLEEPEEITKDGYVFDAWYDNLSKTGDPVVFPLEITSNVTLYANWTIIVYNVDSWDVYQRIDEDGTTNEYGSYLYFGYYPQTLKSSDVTLVNSTVILGSYKYYLGSDNNWYMGVSSSLYSSGYYFDDGTTIYSDTTYYFKVEPIKWRILESANGNEFIFAESILEAMVYDYDNNVYMDSDVRTWLNDEFYNSAFTSAQQELILTTDVDNSVLSTGYSSNSYVSDNTLDKIFLLSYEEITNSDYGFDSNVSDVDTLKSKVTTDYSRASGVYMNTNDYSGNGYYWLRSSSYAHTYYARSVNYSGVIQTTTSSSTIYDAFVRSSYLGVVPACWVSLN